MSERLQAMTEAEYLAWDDQQEMRHEFDGLHVYAMNGGTLGHDTIQRNLTAELVARLRGGRCRSFGPTARLTTGKGRYRYPDAVVTCGPVDLASRNVIDPVAIVEVMSDSTQRTDRSTKLVEYRSMSTLVRYVMLEQDKAEATVITRVADHWSIDLLRAGEILDLPEIGITLPLDALYEGIDLSAAPA